MKKLAASEIAEAYGKIKSSSAVFFSNYFFAEWEGSVSGNLSDKSFWFIKNTEGVNRLYFVTSDFRDLDSILADSELPENLCADYLSKNTLPTELMEWLEKRFTQYAVYQRMNLAKFPPVQDAASPAEISPNELYCDILKTFDPYADYIPEFAQIEDIAMHSWLVGDKKNGKIISYIAFKLTGIRAYINFVANRGGKESMLKLWRDFYARASACGAKSSFLWVDTKNEKALKMYEIEGFKEDGLRNFIYKL